jgi:hypothetical protein
MNTTQTANAETRSKPMFTNTINNKFVSPIILRFLAGRYTATGNRFNPRDQDERELINLIHTDHRWLLEHVNEDENARWCDGHYRVTYWGTRVLAEYHDWRNARN